MQCCHLQFRKTRTLKPRARNSRIENRLSPANFEEPGKLFYGPEFRNRAGCVVKSTFTEGVTLFGGGEGRIYEDVVRYHLCCLQSSQRWPGRFFLWGCLRPKLPADPTGPSAFPLVACPEVVDLLLNFNADVNTCDESGLTASRSPILGRRPSGLSSGHLDSLGLMISPPWVSRPIRERHRLSCAPVYYANGNDDRGPTDQPHPCMGGVGVVSPPGAAFCAVARQIAQGAEPGPGPCPDLFPSRCVPIPPSGHGPTAVRLPGD